MKVTVLFISHRHGEDVTVYAKRELADLALFEYVKTWWDDEMVGRMMDPIEISNITGGDAINLYFENVESEWYYMEEVEVIGS